MNDGDRCPKCQDGVMLRAWPFKPILECGWCKYIEEIDDDRPKRTELKPGQVKFKEEQ
jgi:ribosomal protein S27AE